MALFNANLIIRETRKARGLTQEKLAEGICSRETIVKLEKGQRKPNWYVYRELMRRLGINDESPQQDNFVSDEEVSMFQWLNNCYGLISVNKFDKALAEIKQRDTDDSPLWTSGLWHTMFLRLKAYFYSSTLHAERQTNPHVDPQRTVDCALAYLEYTRANFDVDKITTYFLATHEYEMLNYLATAYTWLDKKDTAVKIWMDMKKNAEKQYTLSTGGLPQSVTLQYRNMLVHLGEALNRMERFEESLKIAEEGLASYNFSHHSPVSYVQYQIIKATALRSLNRVEESRELSKRVLLTMYIFDGYGGIDFALNKKEYEEQYGETLDLSVPW
ncbi:MAG: helix-turn-helix transcriptional regulator [Defluviitaleaceae bacterium]|nr:helix-turn-helix transcriptional regulator [Defluviitaleaceae bacterium]MCL2273681.1 helix-turn-helix transcriptional regulator [Defluviitaleaceae bacterium]